MVNSCFDFLQVNEDEESTDEVVFPTHASLSDDVNMKTLIYVSLVSKLSKNQFKALATASILTPNLTIKKILR